MRDQFRKRRNARDRRLPERLMFHHGVGTVMKYAAEETFPEDRLEKSGQIIEAQLRALALDEIKSVPRGHRLRVAVVAGIILAFISLGASAFLLYEKYCNQQEPPADTENEKQPTHKASKPTDTPVPTVHGPDSEGRPTDTIPRARKESDDVSRNMPPKAPPPHSDLDQQLSLFKSAKGLSDTGRCRQAISRLDTFDEKFPDGPLAFESKELRAKCLFQTGRIAAAERLVNNLVHETISNTKKAALLRFLGDIHLGRGQCDDAVKNYRRALGLGLRPREAGAARGGIATCARRNHQKNDGP